MSLNYLLLMIAEHASTRALDALTTLVLIRVLDTGSLGAFVVDQSRVALILLFFPALENMLYREYGRHRAESRLGHEIAVYRNFNALKLAAAVVLTVAFAAIPVGAIEWPRRLAMFALAFGLPLSQSLYGLHRELLRFELKQGVVVVLNAAQRLTLIGCIVVASRAPGESGTWIAAVSVAVFLAFGGLWAAAARLLLGRVAAVKVPLAEALPRIRTALTEAVLWIHLAGALMAAIQTLDVFFLSRSAAVPLDEIAAYSVALKAANFFQLIPLPFAQFFGVYLGRRRADRGFDERIVWLGFAALAALGVVMWLAGDLAAAPIIEFLSRGKFPPDQIARAVQYFRPMLLGVALQAAGFAHGTYLTSRGRVKRLVCFVHLPWFALSVAGYAWAATTGGPAAAASFNIPVGAFYCLAHVAFFIFSERTTGSASENTRASR